MQSIGFVVPLLPGKTEADRSAMASCWHGERQAAFADSRRRAGITRESVWLQHTPGGDVAVIVMEADDVAVAMHQLGTSDEPFDVWFRAYAQDVHGIDLAEGFPPPEPLLDFRVELPA